MPFKPNYNQQRADRDRAKKQKQQEKLKKREDDAARRKSLRDGEPLAHANGGDPDVDSTERQ
jgi:hypothetical protein